MGIAADVAGQVRLDEEGHVFGDLSGHDPADTTEEEARLCAARRRAHGVVVVGSEQRVVDLIVAKHAVAEHRDPFVPARAAGELGHDRALVREPFLLGLDPDPVVHVDDALFEQQVLQGRALDAFLALLEHAARRQGSGIGARRSDLVRALLLRCLCLGQAGFRLQAEPAQPEQPYQDRREPLPLHSMPSSVGRCVFIRWPDRLLPSLRCLGIRDPCHGAVTALLQVCKSWPAS